MKTLKIPRDSIGSERVLDSSEIHNMDKTPRFQNIPVASRRFPRIIAGKNYQPCLFELQIHLYQDLA